MAPRFSRGESGEICVTLLAMRTARTLHAATAAGARAAADAKGRHGWARGSLLFPLARAHTELEASDCTRRLANVGPEALA